MNNPAPAFSVPDDRPGAPPFSGVERKIAARYLGARKSEGGVALIAVLSFACITLAIFAMITIMSIMNGFRDKMIDLTLGTDGHMYVGVGAANPTPQSMGALRTRIAQVPGVENAFLFTQHDTFVQAAGRASGVRVVGISGADLLAISVIGENIVEGGMQGYGLGNNGGNQIVVGIQFARGLGLEVGDVVTIYSPRLKTTPFGSRPVFKAYEIAAIFHTGLLAADSGTIYMPLSQASLFFEDGRPPSEFQLRLNNADLIHELKPKVQMAAGVPVAVSTWEDKNESIATALRTEQVAMRLIFMIVVVIAVFPILAAMIMLVKNKSRDIAILRTIGTTQNSILRIFLMAGATIGMLGTLTGMALGVMFCLNIAPIQGFLEGLLGFELFPAEAYGIDHLPVKIKPIEVLWVAFWGFLVSATATFFPALSASRVDPVEALRYE